MVTQLVLEQPGLGLTTWEVDLPDPAADEARVDISTVGLNPVDAQLARSGHRDWRYPHVPGLDAVGRIAKLGSDVSGLHVGQRVLWHGDLRGDGVLSEQVNVAAGILTPLTDEIDDVRAAALPCSAMTAWQAVERMQLKPRQTVLIEAGAGGVGFYAIQMAKFKGAVVVTTASDVHHGYLGAAGADQMLDYHTQDVAAEIQQSVGSLDAVLDSVGGEASARDLSLLRRGGQFVSLLGLPDFGDADLFALAPSIHLIGLGGAHQTGKQGQQELGALGEKLVSMMAEGELTSPTIERIAFDPAAVTAALEREGHMPGKQVVQVRAA